MIEMGKSQNFESLPVGCLFRWIGGVSLFKKLNMYDAQVVSRHSEVCHPSWWERTVLVYTETPPDLMG